MSFELSDERRMFAKLLGDFLDQHYGLAVRDRITNGEVDLDPEIWAGQLEIGTLDLLLAEGDAEVGGAGDDIALVFREVGRTLALDPLLGLLGASDALGVLTPDSDLLAGVRSGRDLVLLALEEDDDITGADPATTVAVGTDGLVLAGGKCVVPSAGSADGFLVPARTARDGVSGGVSLVLVRPDDPGVALRRYRLFDGGHAADLVLTEVALPADRIQGRVGGASAALAYALDRSLLALTSEAVGAMVALRDATVEYLRSRKQFGRSIGSFQALQHRMVDVSIEIEQARSAMFNAIDAVDGDDPVARARACAAAKFTAGRVGTLVAEESIQLHGGIGMTWELPAAHLAKRLVAIDHQLGGQDQHLARFIALGGDPR